ncbi:MAG: CBS domain-containing protein [Alphaproteobacteria bacterium]|nr:CBS domain-containing protein [Alphaproteobacteria bacterium]
MTARIILNDKGRMIHTVSPTQSIGAAAQLMAENRIGAVIVVDGTRPVAGVLSERDIVRALARDGARALEDRVAAHMTERVVTCGPDDTISDLMEMMTKGRFRHVPVIDEGRLVGIVSIGDVVKRKIEQSEREVVALREYIATA